MDLFKARKRMHREGDRERSSRIGRLSGRVVNELFAVVHLSSRCGFKCSTGRRGHSLANKSRFIPGCHVNKALALSSGILSAVVKEISSPYQSEPWILRSSK